MLRKAWLQCALVTLIITTWVAIPPDVGAFQGDCIQPQSTGAEPAPVDCLFILRVAAGLQSCDPTPCVCNPAGIGPISALDALICLSSVTHIDVPLNCPCSGGNDCWSSPAPTCGGECGGPSEVCAPDPFYPDECDCLNPCEASAAPTCGGSCESSEPGTVCASVNFSDSGGGNSLDFCACLPPDAEFCTDATAPDCEGACVPGSVCGPAGGGACECSSLPLQGTCAQASAPTCAGTCTDGFICEDDGGSCACVDFVGQPETCFDADAPICGGACAYGDLCAIDFLGTCECFLACELGSAPACGGACDPDETCTHRVLSFGGGSLDFCECRPSE
jgi:hypothetical protein